MNQSKYFGGCAHKNGVTFYGENHISMATYENGEIKIERFEYDDQTRWYDFFNNIPFIRGILDFAEDHFLLFSLVFVLGILEFILNLVFGHKSILTPVNLIFVIPSLFIFLLYIKFSSISRFHGAEHKVANTYQSEVELTMENIKKTTRISPNCGTNITTIFMFFNIILSFFIPSIFSVFISYAIAYEIFWLHNRLFSPFFLVGNSIQKFFSTSEPKEIEIQVALTAFEDALK